MAKKINKPKIKVSKAVDVIEGDKYIRTFSEKVHGKSFKKFAKSFVSKVKGRKIVPSKSRE
ncbi:MAG: hypothetical protein ACTSPO_15255 [Candidatus Heimdallarchaeaceae archaeon]